MRFQGKAGWFVLLGLLMTFAICAGAPAGAANPILPHRFYGNVTISDLPAPVGTHITAFVTGGSEDYTTTVSGEYGTGFLVELFKVQPQGDSTIANGAPISFFINGQQAEVYEVGKGPWMTSFPFKDGGETNLDLRIVGFTPVTFNITATAGSNGNISPSGTVLVNSGDDQAFTMFPDAGYRVDQIIVDGNPVATTPVYTFMNVTNDHTISVSFIEGPPDYFTVALSDDWNLFSTPVKLASGHQNLEDIFSDSLDDVEVILAWDGAGWYIPGYGYEMKPLYAVYVKVDGNATAIIYPSTTVSSPPVRNLNAGLNLIGPAPAYEEGGFPTLPVEDALISIYTVQGGLTGYTIVVSPGLNQPGWSYVRDGSSEDVLPYKGYWVFMENPGAYAGFSTTPI
jgi:hypothetical protein